MRDASVHPIHSGSRDQPEAGPINLVIQDETRDCHQESAECDETLQDESDALDPAVLAQMRSQPDEQSRPQHVQGAEEAALGVGDHADRGLNQQDDNQPDQSERNKREPGLSSPDERERQQRCGPEGKRHPLGVESGQRKTVVEIEERKRNHQPQKHQADPRDRPRKARCRRDGVGRLHAREYTRVVTHVPWRNLCRRYARSCSTPMARSSTCIR